MRHHLEVGRAPRPSGRVPLGELLLQQPRTCQRHGLATSLISEMWSSLSVGGSPRGPLKQLGNPHLKPATKPKPNTPYLTMQDMAHSTKAPLEDPLEQASPRSRARASLGRAPPRSRGCAYLEQAPPRSRVCSALERGPPRSRALRTRAPATVRGHLKP
jgi:hypothetical protein